MKPKNQEDSRRTGILLESEAEKSNVLGADGVEHAADHALHEPVLLVVVHVHHLQSSQVACERHHCVSAQSAAEQYSAYIQEAAW